MENGGLSEPEKFPFFAQIPTARGQEHEVWFIESINRWFKATFANQFGLAWGREGTACPCEYLERLVLQNVYFGDDIRLVAIVKWGEKLRVVTSQPHVAGEHAPNEEIKEWFTGHSFRRLDFSGRVAWYRKLENLLIADAHEGNVIKTDTGALIPIDLNLIQPQGEILEWVRGQIPSSDTLT